MHPRIRSRSPRRPASRSAAPTSARRPPRSAPAPALALAAEPATCTPTPTGCSIAIGEIPPASQVSVTITVAVAKTGSVGPYFEVAIAGQTLQIPIEIAALPADLVLSGIAPVEPPTAGGSGRYRLTVTNDGGEPSEPAEVDAFISNEEAFVRSISIDGRPCGEGCQVPALDPGADPVTVDVVVGVPPGGADSELTVTVGAASATTAIDVPGIPADVVLGDIDEVTSPVAGGAAGAYRVTATNTGGGVSAALPLDVAVPSGVTVLSRSINGEPCESESPCDVPALGPGGTAVIDVTIDVPLAGAAGELTISAGEAATSSYPLNVRAAPADLEITIEPVGEPQAGTVATYRVSIENVGGTASGLLPVLLFFPEGVTSFGLFVDGDQCEGPAGCRTSVDPGATASYDWIVQFDPTGATGELQVRVGEALGSLPIDIAPLPAALTATEFRALDAPTAGGDGQLLLTLRNDGGTDSLQQPLAVGLPAGATVTGYVIDDRTCVPGEVACAVPPIGPGESIDVLIDIAVDITGARGSVDVLSPAVANGSLPINVPGAPAELNVSGISLVDPPTPGGSGTYQLTVANVGGVVSPAVEVTADPPPGATVTSIVIDGESCSPAQQNCTLGPLDPKSDPVPIQVILSIATTGVPRDTLTITVGAQDRAVFVFVGGTDADLTFDPIVVTDPPEAGGTGGFAVTVTNTGGSPSQPQNVTASAPPNATVVALTIDGRPCGPICTLPALPPDADATIGVTISVPITGATGDVKITVGTVTVSTAIDVNGTEPNVVLSGLTELGAPIAGGTGEWRVTATNLGGEISSPVDITVTRPTLVPLRSITVNGVGCPAAGPCVLPALASGATAEIQVLVGIPITGAAGRLDIAAGGAPAVVVLDVDAAPAALDVDPLTVVRQPTLETTGLYELSVSNVGGLTALGLPVTARVPDGAEIAALSVGGRSCGEACVLPELAPSAHVQVTLEVSVTQIGARGDVEVLVGDTSRPASIAVQGAPAELEMPLELTVLDEPVAGGQGRFAVGVTNAGGRPSDREPISIVVPGGVTVTAVTAGGERCVPGEQACTLPEVEPFATADVVVDVDVLPTGAAGEVLVGIAGRTAATTIAVEPTPADLVVSDLAVTQSPTAGGTAQFQLTVTNVGGAVSERQRVSVDALPKGTTLVGLQVGDTACPVDGGECLLPALPGRSDPNQPLLVPVTVTLAVDPGGAAGALTVGVGRTPRTLAVTVDAAEATLFATGKEPLRAGSTSSWALRASVGDPWPITLPIDADGIAISAYPDTCGPVEAQVPSIACKGPTIDPLTLTVSPTRPAGPAQLAGTANDGRIVEIVGQDGAPLPVAGSPAGAPVEFTGRYGGTIVGAETMRCRAEFFVRWLCGGTLGRGMADVDAGPQSIARPEGSTLVYAELTWAATAPSSPGSLDTIATSLSQQPIAGAAPAGAPDTPGQLVRTADVTKLIGDARTIQVKPLAASTTVVGGGADVNTAPMAAWTLTVVWTDPKAPTATVTARTGGQPSTSGTTVDVDTATGSGAPVSVDAAFFATDPWGLKTLSTSRGSVLSRSLWGAPGNVTTGFDLVSVDATDGPLGAPGDAILLTNQPGSLILGFQVPVLLPGDSIWVGPSLVTRIELAPPA